MGGILPDEYLERVEHYDQITEIVMEENLEAEDREAARQAAEDEE